MKEVNLICRRECMPCGNNYIVFVCSETDMNMVIGTDTPLFGSFLRLTGLENKISPVLQYTEQEFNWIRSL